MNYKINRLMICGTAAFFLMSMYAMADTTVCFEAEDAKEIKVPVKITELKDKAEADQVSQGKIIEIEQGAGEGSKVGGSAKYKINLKEDGVYYLWARCWWIDSCGNSFGVKIGDKPEFIMGNDGTYKSWHWIKAKVSIKLDKGVYDLVIDNREDGIKIDQILITSDRKLIPVEIEKSEKLPE
ncbi:MAG TPA: hypothetical protein DET40_23430 [Lentisphaeria bacterium]|nr:MAG: hypothetical protein A2X45_24495 [Lentisphaerae bacterium GWF2_50_93]HCE46508.1 hypothetical protein [Lentisphaeria bacterium]